MLLVNGQLVSVCRRGGVSSFEFELGFVPLFCIGLSLGSPEPLCLDFLGFFLFYRVSFVLFLYVLFLAWQADIEHAAQVLLRV